MTDDISMHRQIPVRVNTVADAAIAPLIEALSRFNNLRTIESCQGDVDNPNGKSPAWVSFIYGKSPDYCNSELSEFVVTYFGPRLIESLGDRVILSIVFDTVGRARGELEIRPGALEQTISAISAIAEDYNTNAVHKCACSCGTWRT